MGGEAQSELWVRVPEGSGTSDSALVPRHPVAAGSGHLHAVLGDLAEQWPLRAQLQKPVGPQSPCGLGCARVCTRTAGRAPVGTRVRRAGQCWGARGGEGRLRAAAGGLLGTACRAELIPQPSGWLPGSGGPPSGTRPGPPRARAFRGPEPPSPRAAADAAPIWRPVPPGRTGGPRDWAFLGQGPLAWPGPPGSLAEWEPGRQAARWVLGVTAP